MHRTAMLPEDWWDLTAEALTEDPAGQDVVALRARIDRLRRALAGRAVVDQACGMVMVLAPCRRGPPGGLLMDISRQCDTGLPEVAAALVAAWEGEPLPLRMRRALRRALRRLYAEDRGLRLTVCGRAVRKGKAMNHARCPGVARPRRRRYRVVQDRCARSGPCGHHHRRACGGHRTDRTAHKDGCVVRTAL